MLHSRQRTRRAGRSLSAPAREDPHSPDSSGYAERNRLFTTTIADIPGLVRVDIGAPAPQQG